MLDPYAAAVEVFFLLTWPLLLVILLAFLHHLGKLGFGQRNK